MTDPIPITIMYKDKDGAYYNFRYWGVNGYTSANPKSSTLPEVFEILKTHINMLREKLDRPAKSDNFWEAFAAFQLKERARHLEDVAKIDRSLKLLEEYRGVDVASLQEAEFVDDDMIIGKSPLGFA